MLSHTAGSACSSSTKYKSVTTCVCFAGNTALVKIFTVIAMGGPAVCLLVLSFLRCDQVALSVVVLMLNHFTFGAVVGGGAKSQVFIAPRFAGLMGAMGSITVYAGGVAMSYVVGAMVPDGTPHQWKSTLYLSSGSKKFF